MIVTLWMYVLKSVLTLMPLFFRGYTDIQVDQMPNSRAGLFMIHTLQTFHLHFLIFYEMLYSILKHEFLKGILDFLDYNFWYSSFSFLYPNSPVYYSPLSYKFLDLFFIKCYWMYLYIHELLSIAFRVHVGLFVCTFSGLTH